MGYFAKIDDDSNKVIEVISISNDVLGEPTLTFPETQAAGRAFIANTLRLPGTWLQCSYNATFRGAYPGPGWIYDPETDTFNPPPAPKESA